MDSGGNIYTAEQAARLRGEGRRDLVPIPHKTLPKVQAMTKDERIAWYEKVKARRRAEKRRRQARRASR